MVFEQVQSPKWKAKTWLELSWPVVSAAILGAMVSNVLGNLCGVFKALIKEISKFTSEIAICIFYALE